MQIIDKPKTTTIINALYAREGLLAPLIIWTQSPLESYVARAAIDIFCEESQQHSWYYHWWDRAAKGAMDIRKNAVRSLIESGWSFGGPAIGYGAWKDLEVYRAEGSISWGDIPPSSRHRFVRSDESASWTKRLERAGVSGTIDQAIGEYRNDFIIDIRSRYKF